MNGEDLLGCFTFDTFGDFAVAGAGILASPDDVAYGGDSEAGELCDAFVPDAILTEFQEVDANRFGVNEPAVPASVGVCFCAPLVHGGAVCAAGLAPALVLCVAGAAGGVSVIRRADSAVSASRRQCGVLVKLSGFPGGLVVRVAETARNRGFLATWVCADTWLAAHARTCAIVRSMDTAWAVLMGAGVTGIFTGVLPWVKEALVSRRAECSRDRDRLYEAILELVDVTVLASFGRNEAMRYALRREKAVANFLLLIPKSESSIGEMVQLATMIVASPGDNMQDLAASQMVSLLAKWFRGEVSATSAFAEFRAALEERFSLMEGVDAARGRGDADE